MVLVRLTLAIACVLLWTAVTACASADPASQPISTQSEPRISETQDVASLTAPSPTAIAVATAIDGAVSAGVSKSVSGADQTASGSSMATAQASPTAEPVSLSTAADTADTSDAELDCTDDANRCNPACMNTMPTSRLFLPEVGDAAYGFTLPGASGQTRSLVSYHGESNVVLVFYRAFW